MKTLKTDPHIYLAVAALTLILSRLGAFAADHNANPSGSWSISTLGTNGTTRTSEQTLKLKLNGNTLTGTLTYNSSPVVNGKVKKSEAPITEAKLDGSDISFNFTHPPAYGNGPNSSYSYHGTIIGDTIKGKLTTTWMDHTNTKTWEARRLKE